MNTAAQFDALAADAEAVGAILARLGSELGLAEPLVRPERGSALVGCTSTDVVKLMAPVDAHLSLAEQASLQALHGRLPVPTPELHEAGEIEGWRWIRMSRLAGHELAELLPTLGQAHRLDLAKQLGEALAVLHGLHAPPEVERVDWAAWCSERLDTLEATQRAKGCPEALLDGLQDYVRGTDLAEGRPGWLHTEVMREHLLARPLGQGWRLSGLFDFEPSWVGPQHYEFASVGLFVSAGDPAVLRAVLDAAAVSASPRRLFAMSMLHRYSNLAWYHRRLGGPLSVDLLAERWFGHAG